VLSPNATEWRELARTAGEAVEVALLRNESGTRAKVVVSDRRLCRHLEFELAASDAASAFERPLRGAASQLSSQAA
jgi:hypothetical protein